MLGQRASSQTVWSLSSRSPRFKWFSDWKWVLLLRAHSGRRGRLGGGALSPIWTSESITLIPYGPEPRIFQIGFGASHGLIVGVRSDQNAGQIVDAGREDHLESLAA